MGEIHAVPIYEFWKIIDDIPTASLLGASDSYRHIPKIVRSPNGSYSQSLFCNRKWWEVHAKKEGILCLFGFWIL